MVTGRAAVQRRFKALPKKIMTAAARAMEEAAQEIVQQMRVLKPNKAIEIDWTWGDVPAGAFTIGTVRGRGYRKLSIRIYATARTSEYPDGFPAIARWFEFGTAPRTQKTTGRAVGQIEASPYFFPAYRANKARAKRKISTAVRKAIREA